MSNFRGNVRCDLMRLVASMLVGASCAVATAARAQTAAPRGSSPNTIVGIVLDNAGRPLPEADVFLRQLQQRTRTRSDGTFSFVALKNGKYDVTARHLGYLSRNHRVTVGDNGGSVTIRMERVAFSLPAVITEAEQNGLSGVVADTALKAMPGVVVQVVGTSRRVTTDSAGAFYIDVDPGQYLVTLQRAGYTRQAIGISVPPKGGRKMAAWMVPQNGKENARDKQNLVEMSQRIMRINPVWARFYSREDMEKMGATDLRQVASRSTVRIMNPDCPVILDGGPYIVPLWQLEVRDLEFVEVHTKNPEVSKVTSITGIPQNSGSVSTNMVTDNVCEVTIYAWMRH